MVFMNFKKDYLYFAKCRRCIMDLVTDFYDENKIVRPRPDFVDYYAILYKKKDGSYININDSETKLREVTDYDNVEETYDCDFICCTQNSNNCRRHKDDGWNDERICTLFAIELQIEAHCHK